jgi:glucose/arabinose dehydrogenase
MKKAFLIVIACCLVAALPACNLRIGSPTKLSDAPAPTTIPLAETAAPADLPSLGAPEKPIVLPPGFAISVYARGLQNPRMLAIGPDGQLYAAERGADRIVRLPDLDGDGRADGIQSVAADLSAPSSLAFHPDGSLYVGETPRILRLSQPDAQGVFQQRQVVIRGLPVEGHNTRTVLISPDGKYLYVSVGSSCNVCLEEDPRRAAILRFNADGSGEEIYASGLRNAVGITFHPSTGELWATNNGRDMLGDDLPPETINRVSQGDDFGWPRCHAGRIVDPEFGGAQGCQGVTAPSVEMQAHSAPLGLAFYTGDQFPAEYQGDLFVAFHGSWNRSQPTGYKVVRIPFDSGKPGPVQDFAVGWLVDGAAWGRPVDLITAPDGSLFVSDDSGGIIYKIFYTGVE